MMQTEGFKDSALLPSVAMLEESLTMIDKQAAKEEDLDLDIP